MRHAPLKISRSRIGQRFAPHRRRVASPATAGGGVALAEDTVAGVDRRRLPWLYRGD